MTYCDYDAYTAHGGKAAQPVIEPWLKRASRVIDRLTYGRAERYASVLSDELADACAQIADLMLTASDGAGNAVRGLASVSNDGASESYASGSDMAQVQDQEYYRALRDALGADPYGLLYAGVYPC